VGHICHPIDNADSLIVLSFSANRTTSSAIASMLNMQGSSDAPLSLRCSHLVACHGRFLQTPLTFLQEAGEQSSRTRRAAVACILQWDGRCPGMAKAAPFSSRCRCGYHTCFARHRRAASYADTYPRRTTIAFPSAESVRCVNLTDHCN